MSARAVAVYALDEVGEALLRAAGELFPHEPAAEVAASIYRRAAAKVSDATLRNVRKRLFSNLSFQLFEPAPQTPDGCAPSSVQGEPMT